MSSKELPLPLQRVVNTYGITIKNDDSMRSRLRNRKWNKEQVKAKEDRLSPVAIEFLDLNNAFNYVRYEGYQCAVAYKRLAWQVAVLEDDIIKLWHRAISREYEFLISEGNVRRDDFKFHNHFMSETNAFHYSDEYWRPKEHVAVLSNVIRLASPQFKNSTRRMVFDDRSIDLLTPHFNIWRERLSDRQILEAQGVMRLHHAWRTNNDAEKQKIHRFVAIHAENIDAALSIIESRYVDTLEQLDSMLEQSGHQSALIDGAL